MSEISREVYTDMKIRTFTHFVEDGTKSIVRNKVMSAASIFTVAASLFVFGIFMAILINVNSVLNLVSDKIEIQAFVKGDPTTIEQQQIGNDLKSITGIKEFTFMSKDDSLKNFKNWLGQNRDLADGLESDNPLPASYTIKVNKPEDVAFVSSQLKKMDYFVKINDGRDLVNKVIKITGFVKVSSFILMAILCVVAVTLISNTIKLTVYARKREIGIMKYIGATDWFIRWPFVIEGILLGFFGAILSLITIVGSYEYAYRAIAKNLMIVNFVPTGIIFHSIFMPFLLSGIVIGGVGSALSIRKFLVV